jgi:hypothetical protein
MGHSILDVVAFIHSHPDIGLSRELRSMGLIGRNNNRLTIDPRSDMSNKSFYDAYNNALYYTYFPMSGNVWEVRKNATPAYIRNVNSYQRFFWGTLNLY